jgi:hypothetical protein
MIELGHPFELLVAVIPHLIYWAETGYHLPRSSSIPINYDNSRGPIFFHALGDTSTSLSREMSVSWSQWHPSTFHHDDLSLNENMKYWRGYPLRRDRGCVYFVSISSFLVVQKNLKGYFLSRIILPSSSFHINQFTLRYPFSKFRRRSRQILSCHAINNMSLVSKGGTLEIPLVTAQTAFDRLRYQLPAKIAVNWRIC